MKKYAFVAMALLFSIGLFAFASSSDQKETETMYWYQFNDLPGDDPEDAQDYSRVFQEPTCPEGSKRCAVLASPASPQDLDHPDLDDVSIIRTKQ